MAYDNLSPDTGHAALADIPTIKSNTNELRTQESGAISTAPPSNPVAFQMWTPSDTKITYQRNGVNNAWNYRWAETDPPAKTSDVTTHVNTSITSAVAAHGIKQGSGNAFDADTLDSYHASFFLAATHAAASSGTHGITGAFVGTTDAQTLTNKTLSGPLITGGTVQTGTFSNPTITGTITGPGVVSGTNIANGTITATNLASACIGQAQLKTASGSVSTTSATPVHLTLPGGEYGFYPQLGSGGVPDAVTYATLCASGAHFAGSTTSIEIYASGSFGAAAVAWQRYIQASPPYNIGAAKWGHFIFLLRDIVTGTVRAAYEAQDPCWAYNGALHLHKDDPDKIAAVPHPFADYWQKDPAVDGLEIVLVDTTTGNTQRWLDESRKVSVSPLGSLHKLIPGKGKAKKPIHALGLPHIPGFTDTVHTVEI